MSNAMSLAFIGDLQRHRRNSGVYEFAGGTDITIIDRCDIDRTMRGRRFDMTFLTSDKSKTKRMKLISMSTNGDIIQMPTETPVRMG